MTTLRPWHTISNNSLYILSIFQDRAYQKKLLELAPRRASTRIAIKMSLKEDSEVIDYEEDEEQLNERERLAEEKRLEEEEKQKERDQLAERRQQGIVDIF